MQKAGFIVVTDHMPDESEPEGTYSNAKGIVGPGGYDGPTDTTALPMPFKMYDDDGELYYTGRMNEAALDNFGILDPLHCFGMPNAGCTELRVKRNGEWETV